MDQLDATLLTRLQANVPIEARPFEPIAQELGIAEHDVLERIGRLKQSGLIRRLGATFRPERLGYVSTLVAVQAPGERLEPLARFVGQFDEVTHCYERDGDWNLWFTVTAESAERLAAVVETVEAEAAGCRLISLPARKRYKLRVEFDFASDDQRRPAARELFEKPVTLGTTANRAVLDEEDTRLIERLCGDVPIEARPFAAIADELGTSEQDVIARMRRFERDGVLRRFGALIRHREAGIGANVMAAWVVPDEQADAVGAYAASLDEVTHCFLRAPAPGWPQTLYAMIHARTRERCDAVAAVIAERFGLTDSVLLASTREFTKRSMRYLDRQRRKENA
jgi:DNA-binding Lrp family transcriptional regulator